MHTLFVSEFNEISSRLLELNAALPILTGQIIRRQLSIPQGNTPAGGVAKGSLPYKHLSYMLPHRKSCLTIKTIGQILHFPHYRKSPREGNRELLESDR